MAMTWNGIAVPASAVHRGTVMHNQLYGGYTVVYSGGSHAQRSGYGPYEPGIGKDNHVERQFWAAMEPDLEADLAADEHETEAALAVIDINQHHTPCSGAHGCTRFLNDQIVGLQAWTNVIGAGRFKAEDRYDSSLSETHPRRAKKSQTREFSEAAPMDVDQPMIVHSTTADDRE